MSKQVKAELLLILVTLFWGVSLILLKVCFKEMKEFNILALRFGLGFITAAAVFYKRLLRSDMRTVKYSLVLGILLFAGYICSTFGAYYTTASNAGFLVSLSVVVVPLTTMLLLKNKVEKRVLAGAVLATAGIGLLTLGNQFSMNKGDLLCIASTGFFSAHIIITDKWTKEVDSISLAILQIGFVGVFSLIFSEMTENTGLPHSKEAWTAIIGLSIFCTAAGIIVQSTAQKYVTPSHVGIIFSLEPAFNAVFAYLILGEVLSVRGYIGAAVLFASILITELDLKSIFRIERDNNRIELPQEQKL